jgi:plasmid stability protein
MGKPLQIRDVPDDVHKALKAKAERAGLSLAAYARRVLERDANRPSVAEVLSRPGNRATEVTATELAKIVRAERDSR